MARKVITHRPDLSEPLRTPQVLAAKIEEFEKNPPIAAVRTYAGTPALWKELHLRALTFTAAEDEDWLKGFHRRVPCGECQRHWIAYRSEHPIDYNKYFDWTVEAHNSVNAKLGKVILTTDEAKALYQDSGKL